MNGKLVGPSLLPATKTVAKVKPSNVPGIVIMSGMIIGPTFAGIMYDQTGSYRVSFLVLAVFASMGALLFAFAGPPKASLRTQAPATVTHSLMGAAAQPVTTSIVR